MKDLYNEISDKIDSVVSIQTETNAETLKWILRDILQLDMTAMGSCF